MFKHSWLVNGACIAGIVVCLVLAPREDTVTSPSVQTESPSVVQSKVILADGLWGSYNVGMVMQCDKAAIAQGKIHRLPKEAVDGLFNQCVYDQGLTI